MHYNYNEYIENLLKEKQEATEMLKRTKAQLNKLDLVVTSLVHDVRRLKQELNDVRSENTEK